MLLFIFLFLFIYDVSPLFFFLPCILSVFFPFLSFSFFSYSLLIMFPTITSFHPSLFPLSHFPHFLSLSTSFFFLLSFTCSISHSLYSYFVSFLLFSSFLSFSSPPTNSYSSPLSYLPSLRSPSSLCWNYSTNNNDPPSPTPPPSPPSPPQLAICFQAPRLISFPFNVPWTRKKSTSPCEWRDIEKKRRTAERGEGRE